MNDQLLTIIEELKTDLHNIISKKGKEQGETATLIERETITAKLSGDYTKLNKLLEKQNIYEYSIWNAKLILNEINNISNVSNNIEKVKLFLQYNSFYDGNTLYYENEISQYSNEQIKQIILNHIFNITNAFFRYNKKVETVMKSYNLLMFGSIGYTNIKIKFSQTQRSVLFQIYQNEIGNLILFGLAKNTMLYFYELAKENKCNFIKIFNIDNENYILLRNIFIVQTGMFHEFEIFKFEIKNNKFKFIKVDFAKFDTKNVQRKYFGRVIDEFKLKQEFKDNYNLMIKDLQQVYNFNLIL